MAEQAPDTVDDRSNLGTGGSELPVAYSPAHPEHNPGRPISWVGTSIVIVGFIIGGISFPISDPAPNWVLFWIGTGIALVGCLVLAFSKAMNTDWY